MIKNIIFDVGGTLTRHARGITWGDALDELADTRGVPRVRLKTFFRDLKRMADARGIPLPLVPPPHQADIVPLQPAGILRELQRFAEAMVLPSESLELLVVLKPRYRLFALTNTWRPHEQRGSLLPYFESFVQSCDIGVRKPDPRAYRYVLDTYGLDPAETLFIDNTDACLDGARAVGLHALKFENYQKLREDLHALGVVAGEGDNTPAQAS